MCCAAKTVAGIALLCLGFILNKSWCLGFPSDIPTALAIVSLLVKCGGVALFLSGVMGNRRQWKEEVADPKVRELVQLRDFADEMEREVGLQEHIEKQRARLRALKEKLEELESQSSSS